MVMRRDVLGVLGGAGTIAVAGCALLEETIEKSADPAGIADDARAETGFEHRSTEELVLERTVEAGGESRDLKLTNYLVGYGKQFEEVGPDAVAFRLFTTPGATVAGQQVNPLHEFDEKRLVRGVLSRAGGSADSLEEVGEQQVTMLDSDVALTIYEGTVEIEGREVDSRLYSSKTTHDEDMVAVLGGHPKLLDEEANIYTNAEGTVHPAEFDS